MTRIRGAGLDRRHDRRTLHLDDYVAPGALADSPAAKEAKDFDAWTQLGNDHTNDCALAAAGHAEQLWAAPNAPAPDVTPDGVIAAYTDARESARQKHGEGIAAVDALNYWRQVGVCKHQIDAYAAVRHGDVRWVRYTIDRFGCAYAVLALPDAVFIDDMTPDTAPEWDTVHGVKNYANDHAVIFIGYDQHMNLTTVTWGKTRETTWAFNQTYCDEMYAPLRPGLQLGDTVAVERWLDDARRAEDVRPRN
jgi:hypothetical protein